MLSTDGSESDEALQSLMSLPEEAPPLAGPDTEDRAMALARSSRSEELVRHCTTPGEGTTALAAMMRRLQSAPSADDARSDLEALAVLRGDPDTTAITEQYERFLRMRSADLLRDGEFEALDEENHPTFMASPEQLAYGRVVGDVLGMDPVLASLLNPTGGLVGAGNMAVERPRDSSIGTHGIVHDAMGYLTNHGYGGPGYDYLGDDAMGPILGTDNPLTGQESGTGFWGDYDGQSGTAQGGGAAAGIGMEYAEAGARWLGERAGEGVALVERGAGAVVDGVTHVAQTGARATGHAVASGRGLAREAVGDARRIGGRAVEIGGSVAGGVVDDVSTIGHHAVDAASSLGGQALDTGSTLLGNAAHAAVGVGSQALGAAGDLASHTVDSASDVAHNGMAAAGTAADQALDGDFGGAASTAWDGWVGAVHGARDTAFGAATGAVDIASDAAHGLVAADRELIHGAADAAWDLGGQAVDAGSGLLNEAWEADKRAARGLVGGARELGGAAWDAGGELVDHAGEAAHGVADDVAQGFGFPDVESAGSWAAEQASNLFGGGDEDEE
jgi:hypothetical protein